MVYGLSSDLAATATSLSLALGHAVDRLPLLVAILARCEALYEQTVAGQSPRTAWAARLDTIGRRVTVTTAAGTLLGTAIGVTPDGALLVRDDRGTEHVIWSGDVTALRSAG